MRIAIDAMGGDFAPKETVAGAIAGLEYLDSSDDLILIGREDLIRAELEEAGWDGNGDRISVVHADEVIEMGDPAVFDLLEQVLE